MKKPTTVGRCVCVFFVGVCWCIPTLIHPISREKPWKIAVSAEVFGNEALQIDATLAKRQL